MSERAVFDPLDTGTPRRPAGRNLMDTRTPFDTDISVVDTEPVMDFGRRDLNCEEFIRHLFKIYVTRQIQCLPSIRWRPLASRITTYTGPFRCSEIIHRVASSMIRLVPTPIR